MTARPRRPILDPRHDHERRYGDDNDTGSTIQRQQTFNYSRQLTEQATLGGQVVTQLTDPAGFVSFQSNWSITSTTQITSSKSIADTIPVAPHTRVIYYCAPMYGEMQGTCSRWGVHGYEDESVWSATRVPNSNGWQEAAMWIDEVPWP